MSNDNQLPKPITITGTAFDNVADEVSDLDSPTDDTSSFNSNSSTDPNDLPIPVVFGDDDEDENEDEAKLEPSIKSPVSGPDNSSSLDEKADLEAEILEDINQNFIQKHESKLAPDITAASDLTSQELPLDLPESDSELLSPSESEPVKVLEEDNLSLANNSDILVPSIPSTSLNPIVTPEPVVAPEPGVTPTQPVSPSLSTPISEPQPQLISKPSPILPTEKSTNTSNSLNPEPEEDKSKFPDQFLAKLKKYETGSDVDNLDSSGLNLDQDTDTDLPTADAVSSNDQVRINPFVASPINPQEIENNAKQAVAQVVNNLNDSVLKSPNRPKPFQTIMTATLSLFLGAGLVVGGYFAAQSIFQPASIPVQAPAEVDRNQPTITPEAETPPTPKPASDSATPKNSPKATPKPTASASKYTHVIVLPTPTGWLNARTSPTTKEDNLLGKIEPDETYPYLDENETGWIKIDIDGKDAWVSSKYVKKLTADEYKGLSTQTPKATPTHTHTPTAELDEEELEE